MELKVIWQLSCNLNSFFISDFLLKVAVTVDQKLMKTEDQSNSLHADKMSTRHTHCSGLGSLCVV